MSLFQPQKSLPPKRDLRLRPKFKRERRLLKKLLQLIKAPRRRLHHQKELQLLTQQMNHSQSKSQSMVAWT
jgi:hemerythrin-like domain-containing protein